MHEPGTSFGTGDEDKPDEQKHGGEYDTFDEYDEYDGYDGEKEDGTINVGKEFLVQRAKPPGYDLDMFGPELLASREKVSVRSAVVAARLHLLLSGGNSLT